MPTSTASSSTARPPTAIQGRPSVAKPPLFKSAAPPPSPVLEVAVKRFMAKDARKIFEAHWEEAKKRFGVWNAGLTLKSFIEKNIKEIDLDPWAEAVRAGESATHLRLRYTGSNSPLTYDCLLVFCKTAPTTRSPCLFHLESKTLIPVSDNVILFRKGQWNYAARPPLPGDGLQLEDWEHVRCLTARFTVPWVDAPAEGHDGTQNVDMEV